MLKSKLICTLLCMLLFSFAFASDIIVKTPVDETYRIDEKNITKIVEANSKKLNLGQFRTEIFLTEKSDTYILTKLSKLSYSVKFMLVKIDNSKLSILQEKYHPKTEDFKLYQKKTSTNTRSTGSQFLFDTPCDYIQSALNATNNVTNFASNEGFSVNKLLGSNASTQNVEFGITCPELIGMGNIGHGNTNGIYLSNGFLDYTWFGAQNLTGKVLYFNSCQVHNDPLESAIMSSARTFIGGDVNLPIGPSEPVYQRFWNYTITQNVAMHTAFDNAIDDMGFPSYMLGFSGDQGKMLLDLSISGPTYLIGHQFDKAPQYHATGTWEVSAEGGIGNYEYQWQHYSTYHGWVDYSGETGSSLTRTLYYKSEGHDLRCIVNSGNQTKNVQIHVYVTGDEPTKQSSKPLTTVLEPNSPNPFNPSTTIKFGIPKTQNVELVVYSITGKKIRTLVSNTMSAGYHSIKWNATDNYGAKVSSGVYIYQLRSGNDVITRKMIFAK